ARVQRSINELLPAALDYLETQAPASGFLFGDAVSVGDISVASQFINARIADYTIDAQRWPLTAGWLARVEALPVVAARIAIENQIVAMVMAKKNAAQ
ncbi:MAG: glutathione S-transferase C-terminal domain-containing protein, partial [Moraxellaceae bacterium]|nr:glutathione S-transferase C-terminal domain-containing protein [Moraxellaceae bacterium]